MTDWLERAQSEIQESLGRPAANADVRVLTAATAAPHLGKSGISNGSNGSTSPTASREIEGGIRPVNLNEVLAAACDGVEGITPEVFRLLLAPEDLDDIAAGDISIETLRGYALSFAEGMRRIRVP